MNRFGFVIRFKFTDGSFGYLGIDKTSGGYLFGTDSIKLAEIFTTIDEAVKHCGKGISSYRYKSGKGTIKNSEEIIELKEEVVDPKEIERICSQYVLERARNTFTEKELQLLFEQLKK